MLTVLVAISLSLHTKDGFKSVTPSSDEETHSEVEERQALDGFDHWRELLEIEVFNLMRLATDAYAMAREAEKGLNISSKKQLQDRFQKHLQEVDRWEKRTQWDVLSALDVPVVERVGADAEHDSSCTPLEEAMQHPHVEAQLDTCARWRDDAGVGGRVVVGSSISIDLWVCGLRSASAHCILEPLRKFLLYALGKLSVLRFASEVAGSSDVEMYLRLFAEAAATSFAGYVQEEHTDCRRLPQCTEVNQEVFERVLLDALAAASGASVVSTNDDWHEDFGEPGMTQLAGADHGALAYVTKWMRIREQSPTFMGGMDRTELDTCVDEGKLHGYNCSTLVYGSTYFQSWLEIMRFPAVDRALSSAVSRNRQRRIVVLGSSLGWQALWSTLTFGVPSVGYDLVQGRIDFARLAAAQVEAAPGSVQFHRADVLLSNVSSATVIYMTDLLWRTDFSTSIAHLIKSQLLDTEDCGSGTVIVSNKNEIWHRMNFSKLGAIGVPVSWSRYQRFHFWSLRGCPRNL